MTPPRRIESKERVPSMNEQKWNYAASCRGLHGEPEGYMKRWRASSFVSTILLEGETRERGGREEDEDPRG